MPKRLRTEKGDFNINALRVVQEATGQTPWVAPAAQPKPKAKAGRRKNPAAVALGRKGGKASGKARMEKIPEEARIAIARHAATARWKAAKGGSKPS